MIQVDVPLMLVAAALLTALSHLIWSVRRKP